MAKSAGVPKKIVVVGSSNTDMVIKTPRLPKPGETIIGGEFFMAAGGKGANQAVAAARAGGDVHFVARVGDDTFGRQALDGFIRDKIHVEHIVQDKGVSSGVALIIVAPDGENSIAVASGANARLDVADIQRAKGIIASADIVLMQLESPFEAVIEAAEVAFAAGDAFNGALAVSLAEGSDLFDAARFGNAAAAITTTTLGAQPSLPLRKEIERLMAGQEVSP